jgi:hypothetical protein
MAEIVINAIRFTDAAQAELDQLGLVERTTHASLEYNLFSHPERQDDTTCTGCGLVSYRAQEKTPSSSNTKQAFCSESDYHSQVCERAHRSPRAWLRYGQSAELLGSAGAACSLQLTSTMRSATAIAPLILGGIGRTVSCTRAATSS